MSTDSVERQVREFYAEAAGVRPGDRIVVAVSGGPDSTVLLHVTHGLREELGFELHVAHFDHRWRDQSAEDAEFVRTMAAQLEIPATIESAQAKEVAGYRGAGMEDAARRARYGFLEKTRLRLGSRFIAVAHNLQDQGETLLLRLFRGTGTAGAGAMRPVSGPLIRPLLGISRESILDYCARCGVSYCTDETNSEAIADRNRLRLNVMPELRRIWPGVDSVLARNAALFAHDALALAWAADTALESVRVTRKEGRVELSRAALRKLPAHVIRLVLRRAAMAAGRSQPPPSVRLEAAMDFCLSRRGGGRVSMGAGVEVVRGYDTLLFRCEGKEPDRILGSASLEPPCAVDVPGLRATLECRIIRDRPEVESVRNSFPTSAPDTAFLDLATVGAPLQVRGRRRGDRLCPLGGSGDVSLSRYLIERRIPSWERDAVPIVAGASGIIWVGGLEIDSRHRVTDRTSNVLHLRLVEAR